MALPDFEHDPPSELYPNQHITLRVESLENIQKLDIRIFYKFSDNQPYRSDDLLALSNRLFQLELPIPNLATSIQYYFLIYESGQIRASLPAIDAENQPFSILSKPAKKDEQISLLHPKENQEYSYKDQFLFVIKNHSPHYLSIKKAYLNDDEPLQLLNESKAFLSFKNTFPVRRGKNKLTVIAEGQDGNRISEHFYFKTEKKALKKEFTYRAQSSFSHLVYGTNKSSSVIHEPFEYAYSGNADLKSSYGSLRIEGLLDSRDASDSQAYHRLSVQGKSTNGHIQFELGDSNVSFSPLTLSGRRVRGVSSKINLLGPFPTDSSLDLSYLSGNTNRAVSAVSGNTTAGTYAQRLSAVQLKYQGFRTKAGLQFLHAEDIVNSLSDEDAGSSNPIENFILSSYINQRFSPLVYINTEFAGSLYYSDSRSPTIDAEELDLPEFLVDRIPLKSSLSFGVASKSEAQFPVFSRDSILKVGYDYILPGYTNVINSSLINDVSNLTLKHTQKLLNKKWIINSQVQFKNDNIINSLNETQYSNSYKINSMYQSKRFGSFNSSYLITNRSNDFSEVTTSNTDINNQLSFIMMGFSGIPLKSSLSNGVINVNYSISEFSDSVNSINNSLSNALGLSISSKYKKSRLTLGFNQSVLRNDSSGTTNYISIYSKLNKQLHQFNVHAGIKAVYGKNNNYDESLRVDSTKLTYQAGASYQKKNHWIFSSTKYSASLDYLNAVDKLDRSDRSSNYYEIYTRVKIDNRF